MNAQITEALVRLHEAHQVGWDDDARDAMRWLEDLCRDEENGGQHAAEIVAADGIFCLTAMLAELPTEQAESARVILASITALPESHVKFAEAETYIQDCVSTVAGGELHDANVQMAASAVANLCAEACDISDQLVEAGAVPALVSLLRRCASAPKGTRTATVRTVQWAAAALCNLSQSGENVVDALVSCDAIEAICTALSHHNDTSTEHFLCGCLCNIAIMDPQALLNSGAVETALTIMQDGQSSRGKRAAVEVISNLQHDSSCDINQKLRNAGAVESLQEVARAKSPKALRKSIESALEGLIVSRDNVAKQSGKRDDRGRPVVKKKSPTARAQKTSRTSERSQSLAPRRLATPSRAHVWVRNAETCKCDDCGEVVDTLCEKCGACKFCRSEGSPCVRRACSGRSGSPRSKSQRSGSQSETMHALNSTSTRQGSMGTRTRDGFSPEKAASLLLSKSWSQRSVEALLRRPEKLRAVMAALCWRPASPTAQHRTTSSRWHSSFANESLSELQGGEHASGQTVGYTMSDGVARAQTAPGSVQTRSWDYSTPTHDVSPSFRPNTAGAYAYVPGGPPARTATAMAQFGRSTNVAALPLWGIDVLNLFMPTGLAPRAVIYRCFGEAFARAEDLVDVLVLERYSVAVLTFRYIDENTCARAYAALQDDEHLQHTANGWPLRLVKEGLLIKTYVKSISGDSEVSIVQERFGNCLDAPEYEECEVLRDASSVAPRDVDEEPAAAEFEAGHLRCFYRNQTDVSEFAYACASAGFATHGHGVVHRQSEWDEQTRSPTRARSSAYAR